jgi:hypothetical protein
VKRCSTAFLQAVVVLIGVAAVAFLLWAPRVDGANANATLFQIYFNSFVAYVYLGSIPFFMALYQAFKLWGYAGRGEVFTQRSLRALRTIKYCALATIGVVAVSLIFMIGGDGEDRPPGLFMRLLVAFPSIVAASAVATFERLLRSVIEGDGRGR